MRKLFAVVFLVTLSSCATVKEAYQERQLLFAPASLNSVASKQILVDAYPIALQAAQHQSNRGNMKAFIDAGNAVNALHCSEWLSRISASKRGLVLSDKNVAVGAGLATTLMGIAEVASSTVAVVGALGTAMAGFSTNIQTDLLVAPSAYQVQTTLLGMLDSCSSQIRDDVATLSFGEAYMRLEGCSRVCSFEAAQAAANSALATTMAVVAPVSGAIKTLAKSTAEVAPAARAVPIPGCPGESLVRDADGSCSIVARDAECRPHFARSVPVEQCGALKP